MSGAGTGPLAPLPALLPPFAEPPAQGLAGFQSADDTKLTIHQLAFFMLWLVCVAAWLLVKGRSLWTWMCCPSDGTSRSPRHLRLWQVSTATLQESVQLLQAVVQFGAIMLYFYVCDMDHIWDVGLRSYNRDVYASIVVLALLVGLLVSVKVIGGQSTNEKIRAAAEAAALHGANRPGADGLLPHHTAVAPAPAPAAARASDIYAPGKPVILNRDQSDEWKGWMQCMFVLYHFFKAREIYNEIRVFVAAYVFLTGFGNFSYFWTKKDFSVFRLVKMLFRLNFLVLLVMVTTNNRYVLYYICPMHTFWFLVIYLCMFACKSHYNNRLVMGTMFTVLFGLAFLIWDWPLSDEEQPKSVTSRSVSAIVGNVVFWPFKFILSESDGTLKEWMIRSGLDHFAAPVGMLFAYFHPTLQRFLVWLEEGSASARPAAVADAQKSGPTFVAANGGGGGAGEVLSSNAFNADVHQRHTANGTADIEPLLGPASAATPRPDFEVSFDDARPRSTRFLLATLWWNLLEFALPSSVVQTLRDASRSRTNTVRLVIKIVLMAVVVGGLALWYSIWGVLPESDYQRVHPYTSPLPILLFLLFRNLWAPLRRRFIGLFAWIGSVTLETYIAQFHILMQYDATRIIILLPGYPMLNFMLVGSIYLYLSYRLFHLTVVLSTLLLPEAAGKSDAAAVTARELMLLRWAALLSVLGVGYLISTFVLHEL